MSRASKLNGLLEGSSYTYELVAAGLDCLDLDPDISKHLQKVLSGLAAGCSNFAFLQKVGWKRRRALHL